MAEHVTGDGKYDVFVVHSSMDNATAEQINKGLQEKGLKTHAYYEEFTFGRSVFHNILSGISQSEAVLILLTTNAMKSHWVTFEVIMALEKSQRENNMCIRIVFVNVNKEERERFTSETLKLIPSIVVDFNKDSWKDDLVEKMKEKVTMTELLPAGNVAHGLVFNYFIGYLAYVLPVISETIKKCKYFDPERFSTKFFILIPESCKVQPPEKGPHGQYTIEKLPEALEVDGEHADKRRKYTPPVYKITNTQTKQFYFFTGDCPFIIATMLKMKQMELSDIDLHLQIVRFKLTLMELVQHHNNNKCNNTAHFVGYSDEEGALASAVWEKLDSDFSKKKEPQKQLQLNAKRGEMDSKTAMIMSYNTEADNEIATEIQEFLASKKVTFRNGDGGGKPWLQEENVRWWIFVISEESVNDSEMMKPFEAALENSITEDLVKVIPILSRGSDLRNIPSAYTWTVLLKRDEPEYLEKLWKTMQVDRKMTEHLPAGNVYQGMAYSFVINYLPFNLTNKTKTGRDFKERFVDAMKKYDADCQVLPKVFIIVPKSCSFPKPGSQFKGEDHLGPMEDVELGGRKYGLQLYRLKMSNGEHVCYSREYATPAVALHEMANTLPFAGISKDQMNVQAFQFSEMCEEIINNDAVNEKIGLIKDKCECVYFDDEKHGMEGVLKLLEERIRSQKDKLISPSH